MKLRATLSITMLAMFLMLLTAAAAVQAGDAQANLSQTINLTGFQFDGVEIPSGRWILSWNTLSGESQPKLQAKGGGIFNTWHTVTLPPLLQHSNNRTIVTIASIPAQTGQDLQFRIKVKSPYGTVPWAYVTVSQEK